MSATDELRRLLDERGVEYEDSELIDTMTYYTEWGGNDGGDGANVYVEYTDGTVLRMFDATPEQAIAATLGRGECEIETCETWLPAERYHRCKHCGAFFAVMNASGDIPPCVCPN
jgi:hypothetical protein